MEETHRCVVIGYWEGGDCSWKAGAKKVGSVESDAELRSTLFKGGRAMDGQWHSHEQAQATFNARHTPRASLSFGQPGLVWSDRLVFSVLPESFTQPHTKSP